MRYSILGFSQDAACGISKQVTDKGEKYKTLSLDVTDLLIVQELADFMNRKKIIKHTIEDKTYFSINYDAILEDLPILGIKKQALRDRIDKLCELGIIEKQVVKNETGSWAAFRLGDIYEDLVYRPSEGVCIPLHRGVYSTTQGCVADYTPNNYSTITNTTIEKEEIDKSISKKDELFEKCWLSYNRKGSKKKAFEQWKKLSDDEQLRVMSHIKAYVSCRERQYQKDFERYLRDKTFDDIVSKGNTIIYDPTRYTSKSYMPQGRNIWFEESTQSYWSMDSFYDEHIYDGYTDDERPDGAEITLNNARGTYKWNSNNKKWEKK